KRFVRDRGLLHAVGMGYGELCPRGRYPTAIVFVDPPAGAVDVNVHPQKIEVRFARPQEVFAAMRHTVAQTLSRAPWLAERPATSASPVSMSAVTSASPPRVSDLALGFASAQERLYGGGLRASYVARASEPRSDPSFEPPLVDGRAYDAGWGE